MSAGSVDLVLVVDASQSMRPCFSQLRQHLDALLQPLQQASFRIRFGLVAYAAAPGRGGPVYDHTFIGGSGIAVLRRLYSPSVDQADFFTSDPGVVSRTLSGLQAQGNENTPLAIDIAADFPFGPVDSTRRVIAVFTDEPLEKGVTEAAALDPLPQLIGKLQARRIQLYVAAPHSDALDELGTLDGAQIQNVEGGDGLRSVDFGKLLRQMGKSISLSTMQMGAEPRWSKALFGQDRWVAEQVVSAENRQVVLSVGESARLSTAGPITDIRVTLQWTAAVDLDLHAFYLSARSRSGHVYFANREEAGIELDHDAGIGDAAGRNVENLSIDALDGFRKIVFATKIFSKGGSYADYDGRVTVKTNNGDEIVVPLSSRERADWCVIAEISVDVNGASVTNVNEVSDVEPSVL